MSNVTGGQWYCGCCDKFLSRQWVTTDERCQACGKPVIPFVAEPEGEVV